MPIEDHPLAEAILDVPDQPQPPKAVRGVAWASQSAPPEWKVVGDVYISGTPACGGFYPHVHSPAVDRPSLPHSIAESHRHIPWLWTPLQSFAQVVWYRERFNPLAPRQKLRASLLGYLRL